MSMNADRAQRIVGGAIDSLTTDKSGVPVATRITQALADAGLLMPDLPDPMQHWEAERTGGTPGSRWYGYEDDGNDDGSGMYSPHRYIDSHPGEVWLDGHVLLSPEDARAYALVLIAAANHAEQEQEHG